MQGAPHVEAPVTPIGRLDGVTMLLISVELWPEWITIHVAALPNERSAELLEDHQRALEAWADGDRDSWPPEEPGVTVAGRLGLTVTDDAGTAYTMAFRSAGGSGSEWRAEWTFQPGAPPAASTMAVTAADAAGGVAVTVPTR